MFEKEINESMKLADGFNKTGKTHLRMAFGFYILTGICGIVPQFRPVRNMLSTGAIMLTLTGIYCFNKSRDLSNQAQHLAETEYYFNALELIEEGIHEANK